MRADVGSNQFSFFCRERRCGQAHVYLVQDEHPNIGLPLLILPESVERRQPCPQGRKKVPAGLFDSLPGRGFQAVLLHEIEDRQFVLSQPLSRRALLLVVEAVHQFNDPAEGLLDRRTVLLLIVSRGDLLVLSLVVHTHGVAREHPGELLFDDVADVLDRGRLARNLLGELVAEPVQVDLAEVEGNANSLVSTGCLRADSLVHDLMEFLEQLRDIRRVAPLSQPFVDRLDVVVPLRIRQRATLGAALEVCQIRRATGAGLCAAGLLAW